MPQPSFEDLLNAIAEKLDIPPGAYDQAKERYRAVGEWLCAEGSPLGTSETVHIYPQGSFELGTAIKPLSGDDYDIDAVVQLPGPQEDWTPFRLKEAVGQRLKAHGEYVRMLEDEKRRCWTLRYASRPNGPGFHLDLLPSVLASAAMGTSALDTQATETAIAITSREDTSMEWRGSDPKGYLAWFHEQMKTASQRQAIQPAGVAGVEAVRDYHHRTPLQRIIQILKRFRDVLFRDNDEHAPISVIITTLAAQAYEGEESLEGTLRGVLQRMPQYVRIQNNTVEIRNPMRPAENFADRWRGDLNKHRAFLRWFNESRQLEEKLRERPLEDLEPILKGIIGETSASEVLAAHRRPSTSPLPPLVRREDRPWEAPAPPTRPLGEWMAGVSRPVAEAPHRAPLQWAFRPDGTSVRIKGHVLRGRGARLGPFSPGDALLPNASLRFDAAVTPAEGAELFWQVVNTGEEAARAGGLRGQFEPGSTFKEESTLYRGDHSIECFVVRRGVCVARSGPFEVKIRY